MKIATLIVNIGEEGEQKHVMVHSTGEEGAESYRIAQELQKIVQSALGMSGKPPVMKPMEG